MQSLAMKVWPQKTYSWINFVTQLVPEWAPYLKDITPLVLPTVGVAGASPELPAGVDPISASSPASRLGSSFMRSEPSSSWWTTDCLYKYVYRFRSSPEPPCCLLGSFLPLPPLCPGRFHLRQFGFPPHREQYSPSTFSAASPKPKLL